MFNAWGLKRKPIPLSMSVSSVWTIGMKQIDTGYSEMLPFKWGQISYALSPKQYSAGFHASHLTRECFAFPCLALNAAVPNPVLMATLIATGKELSSLWENAHPV